MSAVAASVPPVNSSPLPYPPRVRENVPRHLHSPFLSTIYMATTPLKCPFFRTGNAAVFVSSQPPTPGPKRSRKFSLPLRGPHNSCAPSLRCRHKSAFLSFSHVSLRRLTPKHCSPRKVEPIVTSLAPPSEGQEDRYRLFPRLRRGSMFFEQLENVSPSTTLAYYGLFVEYR